MTLNIQAQIQPHAEFKLQNMHLCRGLEVTSGLVMITDLTVADANNHFKAGIWGGTIADGSYKEFNPHISYSDKGFTIEVYDLFNFSPGATYDTDFFNFKNGKNGHLIDLSLTYEFGEKFPLKFNWATLVYGRDRNLNNTKNKYSSYFSVGYMLYKKDDLKIDTHIGYAFALQKGGDSSSFYGDKAGFVDLSVKASKTIRLGNYEIPVFANVVVNPLSNKGYLLFGMTLFSF